MPEFLETTVDKFTFKVATDRFYTREGVWALAEGNRVRLGLSDFLQQRSGDIAFAEIKPIGTALTTGTNLHRSNDQGQRGVDFAGERQRDQVNPEMDTAPEAINQDPYGAGWLAVIAASDWETDRSQLLNAAAYFDVVKREAEEEMKKP
jgi:glycine cleavage system H protein